MKRKKNPLSGKCYFDEDGNLLITQDIKFGGELNPKLSWREWYYLLIESCKEKEIPENVDGFINQVLGSRTTIWRTKKQLIKKGYLK